MQQRLQTLADEVSMLVVWEVIFNIDVARFTVYEQVMASAGERETKCEECMRDFIFCFMTAVLLTTSASSIVSSLINVACPPNASHAPRTLYFVLPSR